MSHLKAEATSGKRQVTDMSVNVWQFARFSPQYISIWLQSTIGEKFIRAIRFVDY